MAGTEEGVVHAGRHDADAPGLAAVERGDLVGLDGAGGQDGVGAVDDGRLGLGPAVGHVGLDLLGHRLRLDAVERVEGAHQRQVQLVLDHVARQPRQPVVGVHRGVGQLAGLPARRPCVRARPAVNSSTTAGRDSLGRTLERAGGNMVHPQARLDVDHGRQIGRPGPGEHVAGHVGAGQGRGQLPHVDVHAAAVARAGLGQGGRVEREDREPAHGGQSLPAAGKTAPARRASAGLTGGSGRAQAEATRSAGSPGRLGRARRRPADRSSAGHVAPSAGASGTGSPRSSSCSRRKER